MENQKVEIGCGSVPVGMLGVAFVVLKLCHVIDWHWFWVLSPFWISVAIYLFWCIVAFIVLVISSGRR